MFVLSLSPGFRCRFTPACVLPALRALLPQPFGLCSAALSGLECLFCPCHRGFAVASPRPVFCQPFGLCCHCLSACVLPPSGFVATAFRPVFCRLRALLPLPFGLCSAALSGLECLFCPCHRGFAVASPRPVFCQPFGLCCRFTPACVLPTLRALLSLHPGLCSASPSGFAVASPRPVFCQPFGLCCRCLGAVVCRLSGCGLTLGLVGE